MTTWVVGSFAALLCLSLIWMTWMLNREMRLRQHVETELEGLATTDPLTTLANRRTLDARLAPGMAAGATRRSLYFADHDGH